MRRAAYRQQGGFALIAAVFILVVLTGLAIFMVNVSAVQHQTATLAIDSAKATYAAESGVEIAAYRALKLGACNADTVQIDRFEVRLTCESTTHRERGANFQVYRIGARAEAGTYGSFGYASRTMRATVTDAP